ncbi:MAG: ankyrin repeat domain-containing protein [Phycisphaerales bacterium]|nr:ankyrin repeat domain-containing protein [Phycisphaerales bacterium]
MISNRRMTNRCLISILAIGGMLFQAGLASAQGKPSAEPPLKPPPSAGEKTPKAAPAGPASGALRAPAAAEPAGGTPIRAQVVTAEPAVIELGEFSTTETKEGSVTLKNTGDQPVTVLSAKASCGCTTADFKKNTELQPGEETVVSVRMRGGPTARTLNKTVTFTIEGYPQVKVPVKGKSIAYVKMTPDRIGINENADGKLVFESIDEQPFKVVNVQPAVAKGTLPDEAKKKHELAIDWDKFLDQAKNTRVTFYFDHPKCTQHFTIVKVDAEQRKILRENANQGRNASTPSTKGDKQSVLTTSGQANTPTRTTPRVDSLSNLVRRGKAQDLKKRLEGGENPNEVDTSGVPLLAIAAKEGNVNVMEVLVDAGAEVNQTDRVGRTALMQAGTSKNAEAVRLLIDQGADVNMRDSFIGGALAWTSGFGTAESVQDLLDAGAQVETVGSATGYTPLIWASGFGDPNSIPMLLDAGANIEAKDGIDGDTALMHACKTGKIEGVHMLLERGAVLEAKNRKGMTPLLSAASHANGSVDKLEVLLAAGADASATDNSGRSALDLAKARTDANAEAVILFLQERSSKSE